MIDSINVLLMLPGNRAADAMGLLTTRPDAIVIDLEAAVRPVEKAGARRSVEAYLRSNALSGTSIYVRVNELGSQWFEGDLALAGLESVTGVVVPRFEELWQLSHVDMAIAEMDRQVHSENETEAVFLVESVDGIAMCAELTASIRTQSRQIAVGFGANDYLKSLGGQRLAESSRGPMTRARGVVVSAARLLGAVAFDSSPGPGASLGEVRLEASQARAMGFSGKFCSRQDHVRIIQEAFRNGGGATG